MALRTFLVCVTLLGVVACAPRQAIGPPAKKASIPVYTCAGGRIRPPGDCRNVEAISASSRMIVPQSNLPARRSK